MHPARWALALVVVAMASGACVATKEVGGSNNATPTSTTIAPSPGSLGADVTYGGVVATVIDVASFDQSPNGVPRIKVVMRSENLTNAVRRNPDVELLCDETTNAGDWYLGSTWEPNVVLPVNAVAQGEVIVGFPVKATNPEYSVVTCTSPRLRMTMLPDDAAPDGPDTTAATTTSTAVDDADALSGIGTPKVVVIPIEDAIISQALRQPRGPSLPLPARGS